MPLTPPFLELTALFVGQLPAGDSRQLRMRVCPIAGANDGLAVRPPIVTIGMTAPRPRLAPPGDLQRGGPGLPPATPFGMMGLHDVVRVEDLAV